MLDIKFIRENPEKVKVNCKNRLADVDIDKLLQLDSERREVVSKIDELRAKRNASSKTKPTPEIIAEMKSRGMTVLPLAYSRAAFVAAIHASGEMLFGLVPSRHAASSKLARLIKPPNPSSLPAFSWASRACRP